MNDDTDPTDPAATGLRTSRWVLVTVGVLALVAALAVIRFVTRDHIDRLDHGHGDRLSITSLAVLPDGRVVAGEQGGGVRVWDPMSGTADFFVWSDRAIEAVATLPDGRIVSTGDDHELIVWDPDVDAMPTVLGTTRAGAITRLSDGRTATLDIDLLRVWADDWSWARVFPAADATSWSLAALPDGRIAAGGDEGALLVWDPAGARTEPASRPVGAARIGTVAALPDGRVVTGGPVVTGGNDGVVRIVDPDDAALEPVELDRRDAKPRSLAVLDDGRVAIGWGDGRVAVHDPSRPGDAPRVLDEDVTAPVLLALSDTRLAVGGADGVIRIWHLD